MDNVIKFPETGFLRLPEVLKLIPISKATWYKRMKDGQFPKPIQLGPRMVAWRTEDIQELIDELSGVSQESIRALYNAKSLKEPA